MIDFQPDYFSKTDNSVIELEESDRNFYEKFIKVQFPMVGKVFAVQSFDSLEVNSTNVKITSEAGTFVLKKWTNSSHQKVSEVVEILTHLQNCGIRTPAPIKNYNGDCISNSDHEFFTLLEYVEGDLFRPTQENLKDLFVAVGDLFSSLRNFSPEKFFPAPGFATPVQIQNSIERSIDNSDIWDELGQEKIRESLNDFLPLISRDLRALSSLPNQGNLQYSHYDLHPKNILFDQKLGFGFLDFDSCTMLNPNTAWGFLLVKNLRQAAVSGNGVGLPSEMAMKVLSHLYEVDFVKDLDIANLPHYGRYEVARRLAIIFDDYTENRKTKWFHMLPVQIQLLRESYLLFGTGEVNY